jgi:hypothetical protein
MKALLLATALGLFVFSGMAMANQIKVTDLDEALCQKLAAAYATDTSFLTVEQIAQLQFWLALTWGQRPDTVPPTAPKSLGIQFQSSSTGNAGTRPPQPPEGLRIQ